MRQLILCPERFAAEFNQVVPGAYRRIKVEDVRDITDCGLIRRHDCYIRDDFETVRRILIYEQLRQNRERRNEIKDTEVAIHCRRCSTLLTAKPTGKRKSPSEYCPDGKPLRSRERNKKWRSRRDNIHSKN